MHQSLSPPNLSTGSAIRPAGSHDSPAVTAVRQRVLEPDPEFRHLVQATPPGATRNLRDFLVASVDDPHEPDLIFQRLRWGGQFAYVGTGRAQVAELARRFGERGFSLVRGPAFARLGWRIPLLSPRAHYFVARKTSLIPPREFSDRFTYHVELEHRDGVVPTGDATLGSDHWIVRKEVPTVERVLARLQIKAPETPVPVLERRAKKFVEQIFPLFLTREAAMLRIIERDCPREYAPRFPRVVAMEKDAKGYVQRLWTTWLRNGGAPIAQVEFARQSAELLHVLHDKVGIIHLDLRMDNMVVTEHGVGFVDFGSAVRVNENIRGNAVLSTLFEELMRTSQIQRMMDKMSTAGALTSRVIRDAYQRVDKAVDVFYLAVQMSQPTANPDLKDLIRYDKFSPEAVELSRLTDEILRPADPKRPRFRSARHVLDEIIRIEQLLRSGRAAGVAAPPPATSADDDESKPKVWIFGA